MCGRYYRIADKQAIIDHFHSPAATDEPFPPGYNIAPGTTQPVIRQGRDTGACELVGMRWGLVGFGSEFGNLAWPTSAVCFGPSLGTLMLRVLGSAGA